MSKNIYRLVKPYQSNKVYEAITVMHGAGKCYKELKKSNVISDSFSIIDVNSSLIYDFNIKQKNEMILKKDPSELLNNVPNKINQNGGDEFFQLKNEIEQLKNRITILEEKIT
jgi:tRNA(Phe) wybutosine-synthesizing methylase Tyw3